MNTTTATTTEYVKQYRIKGSTQDVTDCEYCGRTELKGTTILVALDDDGNEWGDPMYFGVVCAAKIAQSTAKVIRQEVKKADWERKQAVLEKHDREFCEFLARRDQWMRDTYGTDDMHALAVKLGHPGSVRRFVAEYDAIESAPILQRWW